MPNKYGFVIDLRKCIGCYSCQVTCKLENDVPIGKFRNTVKVREGAGSYPDAKWRFLPTLCNHCDNPPCVKACPVPGATYKAEDGRVMIDKDICNGCGYCVYACPYSARYVGPGNVADKCDYCEHMLEKGMKPACVASCMGKARSIGNINDPRSEVSQLIARNKDKIRVRKPEFNTIPSVFYILDTREELKEF